MNPTYAAHFGLKAAPFTKEIPDSQLWLPSSKVALLDELCEALQEKTSIVLVGEPGVGKTCLLRALRERVSQSGYRLTYCHNVTLGRRDFYRQLCLALGLSPFANIASLFFSISRHVEELGKERIQPVFLIDEAHLLHQDMLDHLHILMNYEWDSKPLLSLILVGLPELDDRLALRRNRSLYSRLGRRLSIDALTPEDTAEYLRMRLAQSGCERELFASDAVAMLHEAATGSLRDIDRLATNALREAARRKRKLVERDTISKVLASDSASPVEAP
jgi:type II secretory pathway predicted ATPase ExeA